MLRGKMCNNTDVDATEQDGKTAKSMMAPKSDTLPIVAASKTTLRPRRCLMLTFLAA